MSRLTEHQIRALIPGMYSTAERYRQAGNVSAAARTAKRIREYEAELGEIENRSDLTGNLKKPVANREVTERDPVKLTGNAREDMDHKTKNALQVAGEHLTDAKPEELMELGKWVGRGQGFGLIAAKAQQAMAQCLKRIRDSGSYKATGLPWDRFCPQEIGMDRKTVERLIASEDEFGLGYFAMSQVMRISASTYRLIAGAVDGDTIELDGEKVAITKTNAPRIVEAVAKLAKRVEQQDEALKAKTDLAEKFKGERNAASKAAERARQEFADYKRRESALFAGAGEDEQYRLLLEAQSHFDLAMAKLAAAYGAELSEVNQARYIGVTDYMYQGFVRASFDARDKYGCAFQMATPMELEEAERVAPSPRNLVAEIGGKR